MFPRHDPIILDCDCDICTAQVPWPYEGMTYQRDTKVKMAMVSKGVKAEWRLTKPVDPHVGC